MNNIVSFQTVKNTRLLDKLVENNVYFDVEEDRVQTASGIIIPDRKAIIRKDTRKPLAIVSDRYKTVSNKEMLDNFNNVLGASGINMDGADVRVRQDNHGKRNIIEYIFPEHTITVGKGDTSALTVTLMNGYDGTMGFGAYSGAIRWACMNGQVFGDLAVFYRSKHVQSLAVDEAAEKIGSAIDIFASQEDVYNKMLDTKVTTEQVFQAMKKFCNLDYANTYESWKREVLPSYNRAPKLVSCMEQYLKEAKVLGGNEWALYNALTHLSTHSKMTALRNQQTTENVRKIVSDESIFLSLAA